VLRWPAQEAPPHPPKTNGQTTDFSAEILRELSTAGHRILHVAAHGFVDEQNPDRTGIVIGPESYVTADDVRNLDDVSELVFLNCCHLAAKPALAANLARAFMQSGSQAVIAAGWPVGDDTAERFADCFYLEMLEGSSFGAAVRQARRAAFSGTSESTWAAYQCYGDPGYRLQRQRSRFTGTSRMVSAAEFLRAIDIIRVRASDVGRRGSEAQAKSRATLLAELTALHDSQLGEDGRAGSWLSAVTYAALGEAAFELGDFGLAIEWYAASLRPDKALGPVKALEQLGNAQVRHAAQLARRGDPYQDVLDASLANLEAALRLGKTTERYSLLGSHWKKRAVIASGQFATTGGDNDARARDEALSKAGWHYGWAAKRAPDNPYPVFAWVQLAQLSKECTTSRRQQRFERAEKSSAEGDPDFWQRAAAGDAALTRLVTGELSKEVPDLDARVREATTKYSEAFELRSSWRERDSVLEHIRDLTALSGGATSDALGTLLEKLLDAIEKLGQVA
jgi:tetratricopeptide (TPR) repeat protein